MLFHALLAQTGDTGGASTLSIGGIAAGVTGALAGIQHALHTSNRRRLDRIEAEVNQATNNISAIEADIRWLTLWLTGHSRPKLPEEKPES